MIDKEFVTFEQRTLWCDAVEDTPEHLMPVAVCLLSVNTLPDIDNELTENFHPSALIAMTTKFTDKDKDGKLGWIHLSTEIKQKISSLIYDAGLLDKWVFFAQIPDDK